MVTTEEKISSMKRIIKGSKDLGDSDLIKQTSNRLKELQDELKQEQIIKV